MVVVISKQNKVLIHKYIKLLLCMLVAYPIYYKVLKLLVGSVFIKLGILGLLQKGCIAVGVIMLLLGLVCGLYESISSDIKWIKIQNNELLADDNFERPNKPEITGVTQVLLYPLIGCALGLVVFIVNLAYYDFIFN